MPGPLKDSLYETFFERYPFLIRGNTDNKSTSALLKQYWPVATYSANGDSLIYTHWVWSSTDGRETPLIMVQTFTGRFIVPVKFELNDLSCDRRSFDERYARYKSAFENEFNQLADALCLQEDSNISLHRKRMIAHKLSNVVFRVLLGYTPMNPADTLELMGKAFEMYKMKGQTNHACNPEHTKHPMHGFLERFRSDLPNAILFDRFSLAGAFIDFPYHKYLYFINDEYKVVRLQLDQKITVNVFNPTCNSAMYW